MPNIWNDEMASESQKTALLYEIRRNQSPGLIRMMDALHTPSGRPVSLYVLVNLLNHQCMINYPY